MKQKLLDYNFNHHSPTSEQIEKYDAIRDKFKEVAELICEICPESRERTESMVNIEQAMFWANASVARDKNMP